MEQQVPNSAFALDEGVSGIAVNYDFALFSLVVVLIAIAALGSAGVYFWRSQRFVTASRLSASSDRVLPLSPLATRFLLVRECAWLATPFVVIGSFGVMTSPREFPLRWGLPTTVIAPQLPPAPPKALRIDTDPSQISNASTSADTARPDWVDMPRKIEGDSEWIVLTSSQYTTKEEAEHELRSTTVKLMEEDLRRIQSGSFRPKHWQPAAEDVIAHAVAQRYDDVAERDFGSFTHPMHRVSWQVELSPRVRTEFIPAWRRELISFRILLVAGVASLFAMVASASVLYFRLDALTQGQSRGGLKFLASGVTALWLVMVVSVFSQEHLW